MSIRRVAPATVLSGLAGLVLLTACGTSNSHSNTAATTRASDRLSVKSSLAGHATLPYRIPWTATPNVPPDQISEVDFLIDRRLVWVEHDSPYIFGGDDAGRNRGVLITTWLSPGPHQFVARAIDLKGRATTNRVTARVRPAPQPPAALSGIWTRAVTPGQIASAGPLDGPPPPGRWQLAFDRIGAWELDPQGRGLADEITIHGDRLTVSAPISAAPFINGHSTTTAYGHHDLGGTDCTTAGPSGTYRWSRSGNMLTLTVVYEGCPNRKVIWSGTWKRISHQRTSDFRP